MSILPIQSGHKVLYLGASTGTTASHVSDIVGDNGHVYCVEFAPRVMRELTNNVSSHRRNMSPILADARMPNKYRMLIGDVTDIYCDVAQPEQAKIVADNADMFLEKGGWIMLAVKARSIDVTKEPAEVYRIETNVLKEREFTIKETIHLEPYDKAHAMIVAQYLG
jgi:fibrillarin-like pre-rRNA processing protein